MSAEAYSTLIIPRNMTDECTLVQQKATDYCMCFAHINHYPLLRCSEKPKTTLLCLRSSSCTSGPALKTWVPYACLCHPLIKNMMAFTCANSRVPQHTSNGASHHLCGASHRIASTFGNWHRSTSVPNVYVRCWPSDLLSLNLSPTLQPVVHPSCFILLHTRCP